MATLRVAVLVYILFGALLSIWQDAYLFFTSAAPMDDCAEFSNASIVSASGTRAYLLDSASTTRLAILYHGNAERACDSAYFANWLAGYGYHVLTVEYAGYAGDRSDPSVKLLLADVEHVQGWLAEREYETLLIVGRSIGAGFAAYHASLSSPEKLLLISPFDSLSNLARSHYPIYPVTLLLKTDLNNIATAAFAKDVLIIHGSADDIIPLNHAQALHDRLPQKEKSLVVIEGLGHNDILGTGESWAAIHAFIQ